MIKRKLNTCKWIFVLNFTIGFLWSCDSENASDCFQTSGPTVTEELNLGPFNRVVVNRDIELIISESLDYKVIIETGENLLNDVKVEVIGDRLILTDYNTCNFVRDFGITKIRIETPNLTEIRSSTQYEIKSDGVLNFQDVTLMSEDVIEESAFTVGDFRLTLNSENVNIISNNIAFFYLDGEVENIDIGFFSGSGRFEGANLFAENINISHRGSNDMIVNPQQSLTGELRGTGNLISVSMPPFVDVNQLYTGQLIFN